MTTLIQIQPALIAPSLTNPRKTFDSAKLAELAESIKSSGLHSPVLLRPLPANRLDDTFRNRGDGNPLPTHELVTGERRLRASIMAELPEIPAIVRDLTDAEALEIQVIENLQRDDLAALEEAEGYEHLMQHSGLNADQVAAKIGKSRSYVYARLKLLDLCQEGRQAMREGKLDASKGLLLARIPDSRLQVQALKEITRQDYRGDMLSHRAAAQHIQDNYMLRLADARFPIKDATLVPEAGACKACPKRTGANPDLFADVKGADVCTDVVCYRKKDQVHAERQLEEAKANGLKVISGKEAKELMPHSWSNRVEGHLRLDEKADGVDGQPLRKLLTKQLASGELKPVMVANPHKEGELVAVVPVEKISDALAKAGHTKAAEQRAKESEGDKRREAEEAKAKAKQALEEAWRWATLEATWLRVQQESAEQSSGPQLDEVTRHIALRLAESLNQDHCKRLCKLLELGKVAPKEGLLDWIRTSTTPGAALLLLTMFMEVGYSSWRTDDNANKGLFLVARAFGVDPEAIEAQTRANTRAAKASEKKASKGSAPLPSAAPAKESAAGKPKKAAKSKPAPAPKLSAEEAQRGIADAMQSEEAAADDGRGDEDGSETASAAARAWPFPPRSTSQGADA